MLKFMSFFFVIHPCVFLEKQIASNASFVLGEFENIYRIKRENLNREQNFSYIGYSLGINLNTRKKNKETNSSTNGATTQKQNEIRT
jgi:hypothetical protein